MEFVELTTEEFEKVDFACGNFLQSIEMYKRYQELGRETYLIGVKEKGKILAAGLVLGRKWHFGKKIYRVAGGWLMDYDGGRCNEILGFLTEKARGFCRQKQGVMLEISPNITSQPRDINNRVIEGKDHLATRQELEKLGYKYLGEYEQAKWVYLLELAEKSPESIFKEFRNGHKWEIRRAERDGVRVRELKDDELEILKKITAESGERHGFQEPEMEYYRSMKRNFGKKVKFMVAEIPRENITGVEIVENEVKDGYVPVAASMFVNDGREMVYLYSGSVRKLQKYGGAHLIQWQMIREALESGCQMYNFYGTKPIEGNGVYRFKQGFRGHVEELLGTFALPIGWLGRLYVARLKEREFGAIA